MKTSMLGFLPVHKALPGTGGHARLEHLALAKLARAGGDLPLKDIQPSLVKRLRGLAKAGFVRRSAFHGGYELKAEGWALLREREGRYLANEEENRMRAHLGGLDYTATYRNVLTGQTVERVCVSMDSRSVYAFGDNLDIVSFHLLTEQV
jgi:hypothetical protein